MHRFGSQVVSLVGLGGWRDCRMILAVGMRAMRAPRADDSRG